MRVKKLIKLFILILIFILFFYFFNKNEKIVINRSDSELIENFDLILTQGQSVQSKVLYLLNLSIKGGYTHIGIVCKEGNMIYIIHATPDGTKENCIRYDEFQTFLDLSNVCKYKILRFKFINPNIQQLIRIEVEKYRNSKIPFDYQFNNQKHDHIYCSELIYQIFTKVGLMRPQSFDMTKPINPNEFLYLKELISVTEKSSDKSKFISVCAIKH